MAVINLNKLKLQLDRKYSTPWGNNQLWIKYKNERFPYTFKCKREQFGIYTKSELNDYMKNITIEFKHDWSYVLKDRKVKLWFEDPNDAFLARLNWG